MRRYLSRAFNADVTYETRSPARKEAGNTSLTAVQMAQKTGETRFGGRRMSVQVEIAKAGPATLVEHGKVLSAKGLLPGSESSGGGPGGPSLIAAARQGSEPVD